MTLGRLTGLMAGAAMAMILVADSLPAQDFEGIVKRMEEAARTEPQQWVRLQRVQRQVDQGGKHDALRDLLSRLYRIAPDGTLTEEVIRRDEQMKIAARRAGLLQSYLKFDLDGDAQLTSSERDVFPGPSSVDVTVLFSAGDTDGDGIVTFEEMRALAEKSLEDSPTRSNYMELLLFDADHDGSVDAEDIVASLDAMERHPLRIEPVRGGRVEPVSRCEAPEKPDQAALVVLSAYEGSALSTVSVAGQNGVTHAGQIVIEEGDAPLYVFISSHAPVIWDVTGATERISHFVVQKGGAVEGPGAGVIGLPDDKVHFVDYKTCLDSYVRLGGAEGLLGYREAERSFGHPPDAMISFSTADVVSLPSGSGTSANGQGRDIILFGGQRYEMTPGGPRLLDQHPGQLPDDNPYGTGFVLSSLLRFNPGGIRSFEPEALVAPGEVIEYDVYPAEAGLLQLLLDGSLRYTRDGVFVIEKEIPRFPAGLGGAHAVRFLLAEGVTLPEGSPGHSEVISAETGECLSRLCRSIRRP